MRRLDTKEGRLAVQSSNIEFLLSKGWIKEVYNGLQIFTRQERYFELKIFRDTVSEAIIYKLYRDETSRTAAIASAKSNHDRHVAYKAAQPKRQTQAANCAGTIKEELKKVFPGVKFSVKSSNFSMGDSVDVSWEDGPTSDLVNDVISKYQYGHFDGMTDMYEYTNRRDDFPQSKYVHGSRQMSKETEAILLPITTKMFEKWDGHSGCHNADNFLYRIFCRCAIPVGAIVKGISETGQGGTFDDLFRIDFETTEQETKPAPVKVETGTINIIKYSDRSIAVVGDTKPIKDKLKELGGSFNFRLSCGPGWIFPMSKLETLQNTLVSCSQSA